ncbi:hypothetical protein QBC33DRAFT_114915 [Phialemonium atrogriseum]|uniref:Uncharacterized protein n=1 Tax=Phialemonium atrogriseum TaxID=1093897 RepID=A0AAJ0BXS8_9PEZI|nr:uncharacterized protein QBC33DRAFT_114915 [Phialemonium atrogriseum]KAK1766246.1 hypothetical protein QBC33DRAFT_114915 [Phialemonium atrogriseum]
MSSPDCWPHTQTSGQNLLDTNSFSSRLTDEDPNNHQIYNQHNDRYLLGNKVTRQSKVHTATRRIGFLGNASFVFLLLYLGRRGFPRRDSTSQTPIIYDIYVVLSGNCHQNVLMTLLWFTFLQPKT